MIRSRRVALAAIVVVLGLSACGDPNTTAPLANGPKVLQLSSGQSGTAAGGAAEAAPAAMSAADSKMAFFGPTEFVYDGDLPALDAPAGSWFFPTGQKPDLDRVAQLAAALGAQGEVRALPDDQGGGWAVGPEDYSGTVLTVGSDGMLSWWLSAPPIASAAPAIACGEVLPVEPDVGTGVAGSSGAATDVVAATMPADAVAPDAVAVPDCPAPTPPVGVPTADEALAKAKQLFADWGYDANSYEFDAPYADEWGASVNASLLLEGMKAPIMLSVGFGENGTVTYASGYLAEPQRGDDYPVVGTAAGLERLKTQQNQFVALDSTNAKVTDVGTGVAASDGAATDVAIAPEAPVTAVPCEPESANAACAPTQPEPVTVTLNSARADLIMQWAADNTIWLLPAYTFGSAEGGIYTVIAVDDAYIQEVDPPIAVSEPAVTDSGEVVHPDTAPAGTVDPGTVESSTAIQPEPTATEVSATTPAAP